MAERSIWGSRIGFILASAGSAVGLGAIWKFPYIHEQYLTSDWRLDYFVACWSEMLANDSRRYYS